MLPRAKNPPLAWAAVSRRCELGDGLGYCSRGLAQESTSPTAITLVRESVVLESWSLTSARMTNNFIRRSSSRRGRSTRRPHVTHLTPISAPSRTTRQSKPPHGCGFLSRSTSPTANGIGSAFTIGVVPPCAAQPRCERRWLHQSRNTKAAGNRAHLLFGNRVGTIHCVLDGHRDEVFEYLDVIGVHNARVDRDTPKFSSAGHLRG